MGPYWQGGDVTDEAWLVDVAAHLGGVAGVVAVMLGGSRAAVNTPQSPTTSCVLPATARHAFALAREVAEPGPGDQTGDRGSMGRLAAHQWYLGRLDALIVTLTESKPRGTKPNAIHL